MSRYVIAAFVLSSLLGGCSHAPSASAIPNTPDTTPARAWQSTLASTKIKHIVFIIQENRTFDDVFGGKNPFKNDPDAWDHGFLHDGTKINLTEQAIEKPSCPIGWFSCADPNNYHTQWLYACNAPISPPFPANQPSPCRMDGFDFNTKAQKGYPVPVGVNNSVVFQYLNRSEVLPYWDLAKYYALGDHFFMGHNSESYTAHQYLFMGQSHNTVDPPQYPIGYPCTAYYIYCAYTPWGCDSPKGTKMYTIDANGTEIPRPTAFPSAGPAPCFGGSGYTSLAEAAQSKGMSWRVYLWSLCSGIDALDANSNIRNNTNLWPQGFPMNRCHLSYGPVNTGNIDTKHFRTPSNTFFDDEEPYAGHPGRSLANVTWILPGPYNSDHPGVTGGYCGPTWVASIVNAIGSQDADWNSTAIFITWDDWGGFYDHMPPYVVRDQQGPGFRVPLIVVSPYAKTGAIVKTPTEFATLLKFTENTFDLPSLGATDASSHLNNLDGFFDFNAPPKKFKPITEGLYNTLCYWSSHGYKKSKAHGPDGPAGQASSQSRWIRLVGGDGDDL